MNAKGTFDSIVKHLQQCFYLFTFCLLLFGCTPKLSELNLPVEIKNDFTVTGEQVIPDRWWLAFEDENLNLLVDSALARNLDLLLVWEQIKAARAIYTQEKSNLYPDLTAQARTAISRPQPDFVGGENTQFGGSTSYEVDLWGRIKANTDAAAFRIEATRFDFQSAAISLSAEITNVYFQMISTVQQMKLADEQIANNEQVIKLLRARFGGGQIKGVDILRQQQLLVQIQNLRIDFETSLQRLQNQLAILTGIPPQDYKYQPQDSFPILSASPEAGVPLELVRRRPDLQREYALLLASDREMAAAVANRFPRLSLNLSTQARSNTFNDLFSDWAYTIGGNLVAPLFYWGVLKAEVDRTEAVKNQQLYRYGQAVLTSFQEVEDAYIQEQNQAKQIKLIESRLDIATKVIEQLRSEFIYGITDYLDVLLSLTEQQQLERDLLDARREQYLIRIALYRALAGGFESGQLENTELPKDTNQ